MKVSKSWALDFDKSFAYLKFEGVERGKTESVRKIGVKPSPPIPSPAKVPVLQDEHGRGAVPEPDGKAKIRPIRRKRYG